MVGHYEFWGEHKLLWLPCIVSCRIALPFDKVLELTPFSKVLMPHDPFDFKFLIPVDDLERWLGVIGAVFLYFIIMR